MMAIIRGLRRLLERLGLVKPQTAQEELRGAIDLHHKEGAFVKKDRDMLAASSISPSSIRYPRTFT